MVKRLGVAVLLWQRTGVQLSPGLYSIFFPTAVPSQKEIHLIVLELDKSQKLFRESLLICVLKDLCHRGRMEYNANPMVPGLLFECKLQYLL
jgi:hypothetical protein